MSTMLSSEDPLADRSTQFGMKSLMERSDFETSMQDVMAVVDDKVGKLRSKLS